MIDQEDQHIVHLPWRAFKAFHQMFCLANLDRSLTQGYNAPRIFQKMSSMTLASADHLKKLIDAKVLHYSDTDGMSKFKLSDEAATIGFERYVEHKPIRIIVYPSLISDKSKGWVTCDGHCDYCGEPLTLFGKDAFGQKPVPLTGNAWSCKVCQTLKSGGKGGRTLEEFRFQMTMRCFEKESGVRFSQEQLDYLKTRDISWENVGIQPYEFKFEREQAIIEQEFKEFLKWERSQ